MTETVRGPHVGPDDNGAARGEGTRRLRVERIFTSPGRHPYDEVTWVHRDVVMTNWRDGSVNFEQRGVEFPDFWSQNAVNIVTTKYFRGALGTAQREWSLRQLIDRVIDTYVAEGWRRGYFVTPDDADVFDHELKHMLIHQVFSFNSPVWFNVGTKSPKQVSACQPYDSPVCTPSGPVPIGKLVEDDAVGAKVYDANGVTQIVATKANGVKDVVRLHTTAGFVLDVTTDHLVWRCTGDASGSFVEAGSLGPGDALSWQRTYSFGEGQIDPREIAEAALAGWLQSGGFLGEPEDARRSLTVEASTVTDAEHASVAALLDELRPQAQEAFVKRWGLGRRDKGAEVPPRLLTAPLPVVASYLRSLFQSHGFVSRGQTPPAVEVDTDSEQLARGIQALLARFGIFSCLGFERDRGPRRRGWWTIRIVATADRRAFADEVGFIDPVKIDELQRTLEFSGHSGATTERVEISRVEPMCPMAVYDIQTESGEYLSGGLRVHNCFILAVDDSMDSILEWYKEEGLIFKGGSGAGVNLSRIRSSKELLSSGGTASGPVSFMRGADASAGTIKSGGATRRAAKMVILDVDHPDIEEFIETKAREEEKVRALRDAGFDMDLGGRDIVSVQYQNANNSVRVSDEFMRAVEEGRQFALRGRLDGSVIETRDASSLFRKMAEAAWSCADPGIQYDDTINDWHTCPETGRITASNPCSEYLHLDNSSCNLASLNLLAFLHDDAFDVERFTRAVELVITAMDISICFADFPTQKIAETTRAYRQLGIGYANLGALLMATGHAYDSDGGRALAAGLSSLMTGTAYRRSAELAAVVGPYDGYARNAHAHKRVIRKHAAANDAVRSVGADDYAVLRAATSAWHDAAVLGEQFGYRNSQVSVLAPTGTIGLMMNCDTTGIEPDLALVKLKKLVGGASMQIVNTTVPRALEKLGYPQEQVEAIVEFIKEHGHVVGAPGLRPEHYEVFDCAMGERAILPMGHVRMMAAVQPFVSGAISKTVNMPESASVEDVERIYFEGWKLGLKALAIYRDNCKVGQPLSDARKKSASEEPDRVVEYRPVRRRLPKKRPSQTVSFTVGGAEGYLTAGSYPGDGLGELFIKMSKQGSTLAGMMDAFSIAVSIGLQYGVPLEAFASKFLNMRFEPAGLTDDPDVRMAQSVMDYIFRRLALDFLPYDTRAAYGVFTAEERALAVSGESHGAPSGDEDIDVEALRSSAPIETVPPAEQVASGGGASTFAAPQTEVDAPLCFTCGVTMRPAGSCYVCEQCGSTSGCS